MGKTKATVLDRAFSDRLTSGIDDADLVEFGRPVNAHEEAKIIRHFGYTS